MDRVSDYINRLFGSGSDSELADSVEVEAIYNPFPSGFRVTPDDERRFKKFLQQGNIMDRLASILVPDVVGLKQHKKALLIALASLHDWGDWKNRLHVLFYGPTGTAKTALAMTVMKLGGGWSSSRTTRVGLTGNASSRELTYGLLPSYNGGAVGIDELDKIPAHEQAGCLNAMEEGLIPIHAGRHHRLLSAEVIVIATANDPDKLLPELLDRFDFVLRTPYPDPMQSYRILRYLAKLWGLRKEGGLTEIGKYLTWIRDFEPRLDEDIREDFLRYGKDVIEAIGRGRKLSVRRLETLIRTTLAHARLHRRDVRAEDVQRAAQLTVELNQRPQFLGGTMVKYSVRWATKRPLFQEECLKGEKIPVSLVRAFLALRGYKELEDLVCPCEEEEWWWRYPFEKPEGIFEHPIKWLWSHIRQGHAPQFKVVYYWTWKAGSPYWPEDQIHYVGFRTWWYEWDPKELAFFVKYFEEDIDTI